MKARVLLRHEQDREDACVKGRGIDEKSMQLLDMLSRLAIFLRLKENIKRMTQGYLHWLFGEKSSRLVVKSLVGKKSSLRG